jgi:predicted nuclease with TOPRIM domain
MDETPIRVQEVRTRIRAITAELTKLNYKRKICHDYNDRYDMSTRIMDLHDEQEELEVELAALLS